MSKRLLYRATSPISWTGVSDLNGLPVAAIVVGQLHPPATPKTIAICQALMLQSRIQAFKAIEIVADSNICGDCPLKPVPSTGKYSPNRDRGKVVKLIAQLDKPPMPSK